MIAKHEIEPLKPYRTGYLPVGNGHELYFEEVGNPDGLPVVFLHGGPGAGASQDARALFDPTKFRVIFFDQRGALRSRPLGALKHNTTWDLVADVRQLRVSLGINEWLVFAGSWGVALALAYAPCDAQHILGLILRGAYLGRKSEDIWQYQFGASQLLPDAWADYVSFIPAGERDDLIAAYHRRLTGTDPGLRLAAAQRFLVWGLKTNNFRPDTDSENILLADYAAPFVEATARIAAHYAINHSFLTHDLQLLDAARQLRDIPTAIIHGRYDLAVPFSSAYALRDAMPWAAFEVIEAAGHSANQAEIADRLTANLDLMWCSLTK